MSESKRTSTNGRATRKGWIIVPWPRCAGRSTAKVAFEWCIQCQRRTWTRGFLRRNRCRIFVGRSVDECRSVTRAIKSAQLCWSSAQRRELRGRIAGIYPCRVHPRIRYPPSALMRRDRGKKRNKKLHLREPSIPNIERYWYCNSIEKNFCHPFEIECDRKKNCILSSCVSCSRDLFLYSEFNG